MEWCAKFYEEWRSAENLHRLERTAAVLIIFVMIAGGIYDTGTSAPVTGDEYAVTLAGTGADAAVSSGLAGAGEAGRMVMEGLFFEKNGADVSEMLADLAGSGCSPAALDIDIPVQPRDSAEAVPLTEEIPEEYILPSDTADNAESVPAAPEYPLPAVPPSDNPAGEKPAETVPAVPTDVNGFLVDESGMICGIGEHSAISDGYLALPEEGCTGIRAGAFSDSPAVITEIYIPANITDIEEGAFTGLGELEWLEAEATDNYYTEDGVLFAENGTCILGFPSARTGNYKVPVRVTRFAEDAFADAKIEIIDAVGCSLEDTGNLPSGVRLLRTEDLKG